MIGRSTSMAKWWQGSTHSTDPVEPPESYEATPKSPQLLFDWAEYHFNFSKERVKKVMAAHNLTHFKADAWWTYTELIRQEWEDEQAQSSFPEHCPICSAPVERYRGYDGLFGVKFGWLCTENRFHFMQERVNVLRSKRFANSISETNRQGSAGNSEGTPTEPPANLIGSNVVTAQAGA
jgi:hypothetical protein